MHEKRWMGRVSDKVMAIVLVLENVLRLICGHAPQNDRGMKQWECLYELRIVWWDVHSGDGLIAYLSDINENMGRYVDGFNVSVSNTWSKRGEKGE